MKIGTLCKVIAKSSHNPSQYGHLVVVTGKMITVLVGQNLNTGKEHHSFAKEIEEVKQ